MVSDDEIVFSWSVEVHPQLSHNDHPVDGALVVPGSLWLCWWFC